jgi:signal transduction histidine kinase
VRRLERSRDEVVAQREHEQAIVDVLADGVLVLDAEGRVTSWNQCALSLLNVDGEALVGAPVPMPVGAEGAPVVTQVGRRWVEAVATRLPGTSERVVTLRDISRQRALDEAKDLFLATTSHELRTPLTAVKGYVHVLQRRWDQLDDAARMAALRTIAERTDALVALTDHLLLGARASASRHSATAEPFDLGSTVRSAARAFQGASERHPLRLELPEAPVVAVGDPSSVQHVVGQLLENAVKYSPAGGPVTVAVRAEGSAAVLEVSDEGVGLPPGPSSVLFTPFFQAAKANTREYGGVGLGLYIVRQLVEAQGGTVEAESRPEGGARMRARLPLLAMPTSPLLEAERPPAPAPAAVVDPPERRSGSERGSAADRLAG